MKVKNYVVLMTIRHGLEWLREFQKTMLICFMHSCVLSKLFHWPNRDEACWISECDVQCFVLLKDHYFHHYNACTISAIRVKLELLRFKVGNKPS